MSYNIDFIKTKKLNFNNVYTFLETTDPSPKDEHYISKSLKLNLITKLKTNGLKFEVFDNIEEDYIELNFSSYQVSLFDSEISISVPFWDINGTDKLNTEVKIIINVLVENGFTGFDSQTEEFITKSFDIQKSFNESKTIADDGHNRQENDSNNSVSYISIGFGILILTLILWKVFKGSSTP